MRVSAPRRGSREYFLSMGRTSLPALQARLGRGLSPTVVTWNVVEYRRAAEKHVTAQDVVLEVGCCGGTTTSIIGGTLAYSVLECACRACGLA
jgi:hypothetical protein